MRRKLTSLLLVLAAVPLLGATARAEFVFNPSGTPSGQTFNIDGFDPLPGNAVAEGAVSAITNAQQFGGGDTPGNQFILNYQAAVGSYLPATPNDPNLNQTYQITTTASIREFVSSVNRNTVNFGVSADQTNLPGLTMYQNPVVTFNNGTGQGFNAGTSFLTATPIASPNAGTFSNDGTTGPLGPNGGPTTVNGTGGAVIRFQVTSAIPNNFIVSAPENLQLNFTTSQNLPFLTVDPSVTFFNGFTPTIGSINGLSGPDVRFEADASVRVVPEPSSVVLTALGLVGLVGSYRRLARPRTS